MTIASVAIKIPQPLYHRLEEAAARLQKPIETFLVETLQTVLPPVEEIPEHIQAEVATLDKLDDAALRQVSQSEMELKDQQAFEYLLDLQSSRPLTDEEAAQLAALRTEYGRVLLRKARALALLAEHGQPLSFE